MEQSPVGASVTASLDEDVVVELSDGAEFVSGQVRPEKRDERTLRSC